MRDHGPKAPLDPARQAMRSRLARAHGHLHGVLDMIDEGRSDEDILHQLTAVRAALAKATAILVDDLLVRAKAAKPAAYGPAIERVRAAVHTLA